MGRAYLDSLVDEPSSGLVAALGVLEFMREILGAEVFEELL